jgi:hypothetical protein
MAIHGAVLALLGFEALSALPNALDGSPNRLVDCHGLVVALRRRDDQCHRYGIPRVAFLFLGRRDHYASSVEDFAEHRPAGRVLEAETAFRLTVRLPRT